MIFYFKGTGWKVNCKPQNHKVADFVFEVLVAATGARDALCGMYNEIQEHSFFFKLT